LGIERQLRCRKKASWADKKISLPVAIVMDFKRLLSALVKLQGCSGAPNNIAVEVGGSKKLI